MAIEILPLELRDIADWLIPFDEIRDSSQWGWPLLVQLFADTVLIGAAGWLLAWWLERRHLAHLSRREAELAHICISTRDERRKEGSKAQMLIGNAVMSHDFFRAFRILFHRLFGGQIAPLHRLADRGRRQAIIRLKQRAAEEGMSRLVNLRVHTTPMSLSSALRFEISAYATAVTEPGADRRQDG